MKRPGFYPWADRSRTDDIENNARKSGADFNGKGVYYNAGVPALPGRILRLPAEIAKAYPPIQYNYFNYTYQRF